MSKIEYIIDDVVGNEDNKCVLCQYKNTVITKCCQKKLCGWHSRNNGEHADQAYHSCVQCETCPIHEDGYVRNHATVYCADHNIMKLCAECDDYFCDLHSKHECVWKTVNINS